MTHQEQVQSLLFTNGTYNSRLMKGRHHLFEWLSSYTGKSNSERVWNVLHKRPSCHCGKLTSYIDFVNGYRAVCSRSCAQGGALAFSKSERHINLWSNPDWAAATSLRMKQTHFKNRSKKKLDELLEKQIVPLDDLSPGFDNEYRWQHVCGEIFVKPFKRTFSIYCPKCHVSKGQGQLYEFIRQNYAEAMIVNDRQMIAPKEIDIYLPALRLGFEFNGKYWHRGNGHREEEKVLDAWAEHIRLINVWELNWIKDRKTEQAKILAILKSGRGSLES